MRALTKDDVLDDVRSLPWHDIVFMYPPYGRTMPAWTTKARVDHECGRATLVIGFVPANTDTRWWHDDIAGSADVWLVRGGLHYRDNDQPAPNPLALVQWSATSEHRRLMPPSSLEPSKSGVHRILGSG